MILYIGNKLSKHGVTPTFLELLAPQLALKYPLKSVSDQKNKLLRLFQMVFAVLKFRQDLKLLIIDTYSTSNFWYAIIIAVLGRSFKIKYIPVLRGGNLPYRLKTSPGVSKWLFTNSHANVSPSKYLKEAFENEGFRVEFIPNFLPIESYPYKKRKTYHPNLLWVRSLHNLYNPSLALLSLARLKNHFPMARLCMVGPDKDSSLPGLKKMVKDLNLESNVIFTGKLSKEDWIKLSEDYDLFINTTNFDNHPVSVLEAMALGLPVVSTKVGGIPFLITEKVNGILVPPNDPVAFTTAIIDVLSDPALANRLSENARGEVEQLDWQIIKHKWYNLIDEALQ